MKFLPLRKVLGNSFLLVPYAASVYTWVSVSMRVIVLENSFIFYSVTYIFMCPVSWLFSSHHTSVSIVQRPPFIKIHLLYSVKSPVTGITH